MRRKDMNATQKQLDYIKILIAKKLEFWASDNQNAQAVADQANREKGAFDEDFEDNWLANRSGMNNIYISAEHAKYQEMEIPATKAAASEMIEFLKNTY